MKGIENTSTTSFGSLLRSGTKYKVPLFQRDYSWNEEQWDDLWQDILSMIKDNSDHYMGYLVLQSFEKQKTNLIIDGQQRFTTLTIIILATIKAISKLVPKAEREKEENSKRAKALLSKYIGNEDSVTLDYDNKLELNRNNNGYYRDYIVKLGDLRERGLSASNKLMKKCFEWYEKRLYNKFSTSAEYATFIETIVDNLFFTVITVNDEMNAFRVFETLNARGVQLSSADLLKNYLFSRVADNDDRSPIINSLEQKWNEITKNIKTEKMPDFIRYYWNSKNKTVRSAELFKAVRKDITSSKEVFMLLNEMMGFSDVYMALKNENDELWGHDQDIKDYIGLLNMFYLKQPYSLLMAGYKHLSTPDFKRLLKTTIIICLRYSVICGKNPNDIERVFNDCAVEISKSSTLNMAMLKKVYVKDSEFQNSFAEKSFILNSRTTKIVKYILSKIELQNGGITIDISVDDNSIEHILPENPDENWIIDEFRAELLSPRLGNMCLLEKNKNRDIGNLSYAEKKDTYSSSQFVTTKHIPERYEEWTEQAITSRQKQMAKNAISLWKIDF
jgi:uncharacterized protein with ParB-like and HNH nuclease domain